MTMTSVRGLSVGVSPHVAHVYRAGSPMCRHMRTNNRLYATKKSSAGDDGDVSPLAVGIAVAGLGTSPIAFWSEYTLATTGAGLQGSDIVGALEGISYLMFVGIVAWSVKTKIQTGSGLPAGPSGLIGAAEGVSYLALLGAIGAAAYSALASS